MVQLSEPFKWTLLLCTCSLSLAGPVQVPNLTLPPTAAGNQTAVKNIFNQSYAAYSASFIDDRNGWGATIVDAMGTMILMGFDDLFIKSLEWVTNVDFTESKTAANVDLFETTIRYVGGMLSAYELTGKKYPILVQQSQTLVDKMAFAWSSPNQTIPYGMINSRTTLQSINVSRLSLYTGNQTYTNLSMKNSIHILLFPGPFPGAPSKRSAPPLKANTWGGGTDSYLEYLIKYARISNTDDNLFADTWHAAVDSSIKELLKTSTVGNHAYIADWNDGTIALEGSHLACFLAGNWILGGKLLNNDTIVNIGLEIADSCWNTYASTETGIGPETFQFIDNESFYGKHGFWITGSDYIQRPEVLESNFYAWRATGDTNFQKYLVASETNGYAGLNDVNNIAAGLQDVTESFLDVFNTEGQVFKAPPAKAVYGSGNIAVPAGTFTSKTVTGPVPAISPGPL
ncbi:seven-hairpin glycosidase [Gymnopus androsaceus JB14]|uniref:alpha-1,2-Mannosidase n=1 Tax=Gymnopus androsaceus JB14 TaxID=1447944 RepID=A0A6A4GD03_9AGAR|nr:seven-hairpin glycosidase [Gymnopus androsaceus JB14]